MNIEALEARLRSTLSQRFLPLGVIAVAGTTEDGAVDPAHHIVTLRERLASELGESFWLHIDAAWLYSIAIVSADQVAVSDFVSREWTLQQGRYTKPPLVEMGLA